MDRRFPLHLLSTSDGVRRALAEEAADRLRMAGGEALRHENTHFRQPVHFVACTTAMKISRGELLCDGVLNTRRLVGPLERPWFGRDGADKIVGRFVPSWLFVLVVFRLCRFAR